MKLIAGLLIGFAIGLAVGYLWFHKTNVTTMIVSTDTKMIPLVKSGEKLVWLDPKLKGPGKVDFLYGGGLCNEGNKNITTCTVAPGVDKTPLEYYTYVCDPPTACSDPDAGGGSDSGPLQGQQQGQQKQAQVIAAAGKSADFQVRIYCDGGQPHADQQPSGNVNPNQTILFYPQGSAGTWSAGPDLTKLCNVNQYGPASTTTTCTVQAGAQGPQANQYPYAVNTQMCGNTTATITVNAAPK